MEMSLVAEEIIKYLDRQIWAIAGDDRFFRPFSTHDKKKLIDNLISMIVEDWRIFNNPINNTKNGISKLEMIQLDSITTSYHVVSINFENKSRSRSKSKKRKRSKNIWVDQMIDQENQMIEGDCDKIRDFLEKTLSDDGDHVYEIRLVLPFNDNECPHTIIYTVWSNHE